MNEVTGAPDEELRAWSCAACEQVRPPRIRPEHITQLCVIRCPGVRVPQSRPGTVMSVIIHHTRG